MLCTCNRTGKGITLLSVPRFVGITELKAVFSTASAPAHQQPICLVKDNRFLSLHAGMGFPSSDYTPSRVKKRLQTLQANPCNAVIHRQPRLPAKE